MYYICIYSWFIKHTIEGKQGFYKIHPHKKLFHITLAYAFKTTRVNYLIPALDFASTINRLFMQTSWANTSTQLGNMFNIELNSAHEILQKTCFTYRFIV